MTRLDDDALESLAASLLCDEAPPESVHRSWMDDHASGRGRARGREAPDGIAPVTPLSAFRSRRGAGVLSAAAAAVVLAGGAGLVGIDGMPTSSGGDGGEMSSESPAQTDFEPTALGPAVAGAMGERDFTGLADPSLAATCLAAHGEDEDALLGAAPMADGKRVGQLFVLSTGMPGRVTVLLTVNTCGTGPEAALVHRTIGEPG